MTNIKNNSNEDGCYRFVNIRLYLCQNKLLNHRD